MTNFVSPDNFEFFARYLLAGFILLSVRSRYVATQRPKATEVVFDAVILSLINQLAFLVLVSLSGWVGIFSENDSKPFFELATESRLLFFTEVLALPSILGVIFGKALASDWKLPIIRRLALPNSHPTERGYDYAFANRSGPCFVIVTYVDGTEVYGYYGNSSLAATDANRSDIYLERLYSVGVNGQWEETAPNRSAYLSLNGVRSIEFLEEDHLNGQKTTG